MYSAGKARQGAPVAGGRTTAQSNAQRAAADDAATTGGDDDMLPPNMNHIGVLDLAGQQMAAAIAGIKQGGAAAEREASSGQADGVNRSCGAGGRAKSQASDRYRSQGTGD